MHPGWMTPLPRTFVDAARSHTFAPPWLPGTWRHPAVGYVLATGLETAAALFTVMLAHASTGLALSAPLPILIVALVALTWGAGPSLLATLLGTALLDLVVLPATHPHYAGQTGELVADLQFLSVGVTISVLASQTERARRGAQAAATRLTAVIAAVPDPLITYDTAGRVVDTNAPVSGKRDGLGKLTEQLLDPAAWVTGTGSPLAPRDLPVARALRGDTVTGMELQVSDAHDGDRSLVISAAPFMAAEDSIAGAVAIVHDISALRQAQQDAAAQASRLQAIINAIADGVVVYDRDGEILHMNAAAHALLPSTQEPGFSGHPLHERGASTIVADGQGRMLPREQWPAFRVLNGEVLAGAGAMDVTFPASHQRNLLVNVSGAPVYDQRGMVSGAALVVRDVTVRRQVERHGRATVQALLAMAEALVQLPPADDGAAEEPTTLTRMVAQRLLDVLGSLLDGARGSITTYSPRARMLYPLVAVGFSEDEEQTWRAGEAGQIVSGSPATEAALARLRAGETIILDGRRGPVNQWPHRCVDGTSLLSPLSLGDRLLGYLSVDYAGVAHVFTLEESALVGAVARLAAIVVERERLLGEQLAAARLEEVDRLRSAFVAAVSHDLQTPLTAARAGLGLLDTSAHERLTPAEAALLQNARRNVERLRVQITDLVTVNQLDAGVLQLERVPLDLRMVALGALPVVQPLIQAKDQTLAISLDEPLPVEGDPQKLEQVVINLLANAHRHTPSGTSITLAGWATTTEVLLRVCDDGPGIPTANLEHIFARFHRLDARVTGSGLGLAIAREIVTLHGGRLWADSPAGGGAVFTLAIPPAIPGGVSCPLLS